jgi:exportin-2 (importin alpha re-exporter)
LNFYLESDVEEFEDNPEEYIRKDIEKSGYIFLMKINENIIFLFIDSATRRRAACDFLQTLCIFFESQVVAIYSQYIDTMQKVFMNSKFL